MTCREAVREYFPNADDDVADSVLWECTGFPAFFQTTPEFPTNESVMRRQLQEAKDKSGGDPVLAIMQCSEELARSMEAAYRYDTEPILKVKTWRVLEGAS